MQSKPCKVCGREIEWRKKWERDWDNVHYCSDRCRRAKKSIDGNYETRILEKLAARARGATICPSEILDGALKKDRDEMERVREAARRLVHQGRIEITQKGRVVDPSSFRGPIRLRLKE